MGGHGHVVFNRLIAESQKREFLRLNEVLPQVVLKCHLRLCILESFLFARLKVKILHSLKPRDSFDWLFLHICVVNEILLFEEVEGQVSEVIFKFLTFGTSLTFW